MKKCGAAVPWSVPLPFSPGRRPNSDTVITSARSAGLRLVERREERRRSPSSRSAMSSGMPLRLALVRVVVAEPAHVDRRAADASRRRVPRRGASSRRPSRSAGSCPAPFAAPSSSLGPVAPAASLARSARRSARAFDREVDRLLHLAQQRRGIRRRGRELRPRLRRDRPACRPMRAPTAADPCVSVIDVANECVPSSAGDGKGPMPTAGERVVEAHRAVEVAAEPARRCRSPRARLPTSTRATRNARGWAPGTRRPRRWPPTRLGSARRASPGSGAARRRRRAVWRW